MTRHKAIPTHRAYPARGVPLLLALLLALAATGLVANKASADEPYGGCDEAWQAPQSAGADWCRDHGWIVRPRIVVGPHGWVKANRMPACYYEDGSTQRHCFWDADARGNKDGMDYIVDRPDERYGHGWIRFTYVKG